MTDLFGQLWGLVCASGALLGAKSVLLGMRSLALLLVAAYSRDSELAAASFALSLAEIGRWIADFGTDTWNVRALATAGDPHREARLMTAALLIKAIGSVLIGSLIVLVCRLELPTHAVVLGSLAALLLLTSQVAGLTIAYFQAKDRVARLAPSLIPCGGTLLAVLLVLKMTGATLPALMVLTLGEIVIAAILLILLQRRAAFTSVAAVWPEVGRVARSCIPTAAFGVVVGIYSRLDSIALAEFSLASLAVYTVAQRLFQPFQIAVTSFGSIVYSRTTQLRSEGRPVAKQLLRKEMPIILGCALGCAVALFFGGGLVVERVFPRYEATLGPLRILCGSLPLLAFNSAITGLLLGYGRYWTVLLVATLDLILTYIGMMLLIPAYGATGTAVSLIIGAVINATALSVGAILVTRRKGVEVTAPDCMSVER